MKSSYLRCKSIIYSDHAVNQLFKRNISVNEIEIIIESGEIIFNYPNDKPFPSCLLFGFVGERPIHLVIARNELEKKCIVVTAYEPDVKVWDQNFKSKLK